MTAKQWVFENVGHGFITIKIREEDRIVRAEGLAPGAIKPVRNIFRKKDGSVDVDAAKANEDVKAHVEAKYLKMYEREIVMKEGNTGPLFNSTDPEETRVAKVLAHRLKVKEEARRALAAREAKSSTASAEERDAKPEVRPTKRERE